MGSLEARVPPPIVAAAAALLMWLIARGAPELAFAFEGHVLAAATVAAVGLATVVTGALQFHRARTTLTPLNPGAASALVVSGLYRYTRNPMYLGIAIVLLAWALYLSHPLSALGVAAFVAYIHRFQIIPEERALRALFPGAFEAYARKVRRWI
jgi:protein-S-isoprenylcysteine O-methyltransferase Ste14